MDGADVCGTSSRASRRPPNVTCGAAILDPRWRRRKWHQPGLGASFSIPIEGEVQNGDPSASGGHLGWPHLRNRKWGHPRWPPEAEGPPFCTSPSMGSKNSPYTTREAVDLRHNRAHYDVIVMIYGFVLLSQRAKCTLKTSLRDVIKSGLQDVYEDTCKK